MKPGKFAYFDPGSVDETTALLSEHGDDAKVLAGGQSLMPMLSMRLSYPAVLVDLNRVGELEYIRETPGGLAIGAMTRHGQVEESEAVRRSAPLIGKAMPWIGHRAIRNRGTIGGSLAHADPAAELPAVMTALGATVVAQSTGGKRRIPLTELFEMPLVSTLRPDELLVEVEVPAQPADAGSAVVEIARRHGDFALAGVVATVRLDSGGRIGEARLVSFATGPTPQRLSGAEAALAGAEPGEAAFAAAGEAAQGEISPTSDLHGSEEYRRSVTSVLVGRALEEAVADARGRADGSNQRSQL